VQINGTPAGYQTAETRNRIVNGAMQISQENGTTSGTGNAYYAADQWYCGGIGTAVVTQQKVAAGVSASGFVNRLRYTVSTADASLTTNEYFAIRQNIEGINIADFDWGRVTARQVILRFGIKGPAGTYCVSIRNAADDRTYLAPFTIPVANTDTDVVLIIPGDTTSSAVWPITTAKGMVIDFCLGAGPSLVGAAGWNAGSLLGVTGITNGLATASNVFELYNVGLYLDPLATGVPPRWQMPDEAEELRVCQRYFQKYSLLEAGGGAAGFAAGVIISTVTAYVFMPFITRTRAAPTLSALGIADITVRAATALTASAIVTPAPTTTGSSMSITVAGGTVGQGCVARFDTINAAMLVNARM
jgi:hypothetical protein